MSAPSGCTLTGQSATCSYASWAPPLLDSQFSSSPGDVIVNDINGVIQSDSFIGLENTGGYSGTPQISLDCGFGNGYEMTLLSDSLSANLSWVENMLITDCNNMVIEDGAFSVLTGLTLLTIMAGNITSISSTALSGMTSLTTLYFYAGFPPSGVPSGLLDGLTALTSVDMSRTNLYSLPSGLFDDLKNLTSLTLLDCELTTLPSDLFYPLLSLTSLDISQNSWECDCQLQWLGTYLSSTGLMSDNCSSPASLSGYDLSRTLLSLTCSTEPSDNDDDWYRYGLIAGCSLALILALIAILGCIYQRKKYKKLQKSMRKQQTTSNAGTDKTNNLKRNQNNAGDDRGTSKQKKDHDNNMLTVHSEELSKRNGNHGNQFNKRTRQISPSSVRIQNGWTSQRDQDEW